MSRKYLGISSLLILAASSAFAGGVGAEGEIQQTLYVSNLIDATQNAKDAKVLAVKLKSNLAYQQKVTIETNTINCDSMGHPNSESAPFDSCVTRKNLPGADFVEVKVQYSDYLPDSRTQGDTSSWQKVTTSVYLNPKLFTHGLQAQVQVRTAAHTQVEPIYAPNGGDCFDAPASCVPTIIGQHAVTTGSTFLQVTPSL